MRPGTAPNFEYQPVRDNTIVVNDAAPKWEPVSAYYAPWQASSTFSHNDPLDLMAPAEIADLPELEFPVPDQDVIPEMIFEHEEQNSSGRVQAASSAAPIPLKQEIDNSADQFYTGSSTDSSNGESESPSVHETSISVSSSSLPSDHPALIPIQSCIIAHARTGNAALAAAHERRLKNTESARRSRARRADKLVVLREQNAELLARNEILVKENERLKKAVSVLKSHVTIKVE